MDQSVDQDFDLFLNVNNNQFLPPVSTGPLPAHDGSTGASAAYSVAPSTIIEDFGLEQRDPETLDYSNFAKWIPRYSLPSKPCEYCASRHLECWYSYDGQTGCSACRALFRTCSFTNHQLSGSQALMDTLHVVQEDAVQSEGALTGAKALRSWDRTPLDHPTVNLDDRASKRSTGNRFSRDALKILKTWVEQHADYPYPTEEEKDNLASFTNLSVPQISNWFANTRRRNKKRAAGCMSPRAPSPTRISSSPAINIPANRQGIVQDGKTWDIMNPMERWKASPPENEPAAVDAIAQAVASSRLASHDSGASQSQSRITAVSSGDSRSASIHWAPSITSLETGQSESHKSSESFSNHSLGSSRSHGSRNSAQSYRSGQRKDRRRRKRNMTSSRSMGPSQQRPFQCTFCTDTFRTKYDWTRHEKSLHLSLEKWICAPLGDVITDATTGNRICVFCEQQNPSQEHLKSHGHDQCEEKGMEARTFYRKDHLRQHLRLVHGCSMIKSMDTWKSEATYIRCRCGFCGQKFTSWTDRCDHIAKHFRSGSHMRDWKGCRGFDAEVSAFVTNAMPPFLIGTEASSVDPFSASNEASMAFHGTSSMNVTAGSPYMQQFFAPAPFLNLDWSKLQPPTSTSAAISSGMNDMSIASTTAPYAMNLQGHSISRPNLRISTCWEILTIRLGKWLQEQLQRGEVPSDEMLQRQARWILYESDDDWNQTAADNPEWLELFKKAHGMPSKATDTWIDWSEDLGAVGELSFDALTFEDQVSASYSLNPVLQAVSGAPFSSAGV